MTEYEILYGIFALVICCIGLWAFKKNYHTNSKDEFTYFDLDEEYRKWK